MNILLFIYVVLAHTSLWGPCGLAESSAEGSYDGSREGGSVINGELGDIKRHPHPYVVEIQHYNKTREFWHFRCVGSIMNANTILTACHCIKEAPFTEDHIEFKDIKDVRVLAGRTNGYAHSQPQIVGAKQFFPHPQCRSPLDVGYNTDVAVIKLESDLNLSVDGVKRIKLFSKDPSVVVEEQNRLVDSGAKCYSVGWGPTEAPPSTKSLDELQETTLHLISSYECSKLWCEFDQYYCHEDLDRYNYICAISDNATLCRGDYGGPLICNDYLFGIDNFGDQTCRFEVPTIFADINAILYFVDFFQVLTQ